MPARSSYSAADLDPRVGAALGGLAALLLPAALVPLRSELSGSALALLLVLPVLLGAVTGGRLGGAISAAIATLSFDFFLTQPYLSLTIDSCDDVETAVLFLLVALIVGTVAAGARRNSFKADRGRAELDAIHRVAASTERPDTADEIVETARKELIRLLRLEACEFDRTTTSSSLPVLEHSGTYQTDHFHYVHGGFRLPSGIELPVSGGGRPQGRFVLHGRPDVAVTIDARIAAVVIADQVGSALAALSNGTKREERA